MNVCPKLGGGIPFHPEFGGGQVHIFRVSVRKSLGNAYLVEFLEIFSYNSGNAFEFLIFIPFQNVLVCFSNKVNIIVYTVHSYGTPPPFAIDSPIRTIAGSSLSRNLRSFSSFSVKENTYVSTEYKTDLI